MNHSGGSGLTIGGADCAAARPGRIGAREHRSGHGGQREQLPARERALRLPPPVLLARELIDLLVVHVTLPSSVWELLLYLVYRFSRECQQDFEPHAVQASRTSV